MRNKIRNSLRASFIDGTFFAVMFGFGDSNFTAYAVLLKATNFQIGLLSSFPGLVSALLQVRAPEWTEKIGRYRIMYWCILFQVLMWLPIILVPYLFHHNPVPWLILGVTLYLLSSALAGPAWSSIMSQYLPRDKRGKYFSWRQRIHGTITIAATFAAGLVLYLFPKSSVTGFTVIFSVAFLARFFSWRYLAKMYEPRLVCKPSSAFTLRDFIRRSKKSNFAKFVFFNGAMSFVVNLSGPFFSVYMLRNLHFDYLSYVVVNTIPTIATLLTLPAWGRHTDRAGCMRIIRFTSILLPIVPVVWLFSSSKLYLAGAQFFSGFAWAGFNLAVANFILDAVSEEKRVRCIAYFNLVNGLGVFFGATLGGAIIGILPPVLGSRILTIFLLSGILRLVVRQLFLPIMREVRKVEKVSNWQLLFNVIGLHPEHAERPKQIAAPARAMEDVEAGR